MLIYFLSFQIMSSKCEVLDTCHFGVNPTQMNQLHTHCRENIGKINNELEQCRKQINALNSERKDALYSATTILKVNIPNFYSNNSYEPFIAATSASLKNLKNSLENFNDYPNLALLDQLFYLNMTKKTTQNQIINNSQPDIDGLKVFGLQPPLRIQNKHKH